jgi:hypothetical protein
MIMFFEIHAIAGGTHSFMFLLRHLSKTNNWKNRSFTQLRQCIASRAYGFGHARTSNAFAFSAFVHWLENLLT